MALIVYGVGSQWHAVMHGFSDAGYVLAVIVVAAVGLFLVHRYRSYGLAVAGELPPTKSTQPRAALPTTTGADRRPAGRAPRVAVHAHRRRRGPTAAELRSITVGLLQRRRQVPVDAPALPRKVVLTGPRRGQRVRTGSRQQVGPDQVVREVRAGALPPTPRT